MIDLLVETNSAKFIQKYRGKLRENIAMNLDQNWNSVNYLDFIFNERISKINDPDAKLTEVFELSCYLGICIYKIWARAFDTKPKLHIIEKPKACLELKLESGPYIEDTPISIDLYTALSEILFKTSKYTKNSEIPYGIENFKIQYLAQSIATGIAPGIKGPWNALSDRDLAPIFHTVGLEITKDTVIPLQLNYPEQTDYLSPEVFFPHLVIPPLGYDDDLLGARPIYGICKIALIAGLGKEELGKLATILIESPSILQASIGFIILANTKPITHRNVLSEFALHFPTLTYRLKPAYNLFAKEFLKSEDWTMLGKMTGPEQLIKAQTRLQQDIDLGLMPIFHCPDLSLPFERKYRAYFELIDLFMADGAYERGKRFKNPPTGIILQQAFLACHLNLNQEAKNLISEIELSSLSPKELSFLLYINFLIPENHQDSKSITNQALALVTSNDLPSLRKKALLLTAVTNNIIDAKSLVDSKIIDQNNISQGLISYLRDQEIELLDKNSTLLSFRASFRSALWSPSNIFTKLK